MGRQQGQLAAKVYCPLPSVLARRQKPHNLPGFLYLPFPLTFYGPELVSSWKKKWVTSCPTVTVGNGKWRRGLERFLNGRGESVGSPNLGPCSALCNLIYNRTKSAFLVVTFLYLKFLLLCLVPPIWPFLEKISGIELANHTFIW